MSNDAESAAEVIVDITAGWNVRQIQEVADVNPRIDKKAIPDDLVVSFVPMPAVKAESGQIDVSEVKLAKQVKKGFTAFLEGDVLFAKITPCMENGKMAIAPALINDYGFGSTEFHVLRAGDDIDAKYLYYYVSSKSFRGEAERFMTGAVGQKRVSTTYIKEATIPVAPLEDQRRIVAEIEKQFSRLDETVTSLKRVKANLKGYKAAVLKAAVEGKLTEEWRKQNPDVEPASKLLERILAERRAKWEEAELAKMKAKGKESKNGKWKDKYKHLSTPDLASLPMLPATWVWASPEQLASTDAYSLAIGPFGSNLKVKDYSESGVPLIFVRNIRKADFGDGGTKYVVAEKAIELNAHSVDGGDILITKMGDPPGDACLYPKDSPHAIITADCIKWRLSGLLPHQDYFVDAINSHCLAEQIRKITKGVAQQKVSLARFRVVAIPVPPVAEQSALEDIVSVIHSLIEVQTLQIEMATMRAASLRQSILAALFSGGEG